MAFIYKISNTIDDRVYIGSTININKRWSEHKRDLFKNKHINKHLQRFVNKYGLDVLFFEVIEKVSDNLMLMKEQYYLDSTLNKFNIANNTSAPMLGKSHTKQAVEKISKRSSGINNPMFGKKRPKWLIDKIIYANKNRQKTLNEKIIRQINLPNRKEIKILKNNETIHCFSISHASKIIKVSPQSISKSLNFGSKSKGYSILKSEDNFYDKYLLLSNIHLFDENCHPKPDLIEILKNLN